MLFIVMCLYFVVVNTHGVPQGLFPWGKPFSFQTSLNFFGGSALHTAGVRRTANGATALVQESGSEATKQHVNNDEKHVSSKDQVDFVEVVVDKKVEGIDYAVKSSKGRSSGKRMKGDGQLFCATGAPPRYRIPAREKTLTIVQSQLGGPISSSSTVATFVAFVFTAGGLDQISQLTALFDQYRIDLVELWLMPRVSIGAGATNTGLLTTVLDYDDTVALSTVAQALDYTNAVVGSGMDGHYRCFKPHAAIAAYSGAFTSYVNVVSPWIDAASTAVSHYGVKTAWSVCDQAYTMDVVYRLTTTWRSVR
jgi:hypothetical protein